MLNTLRRQIYNATCGLEARLAPPCASQQPQAAHVDAAADWVARAQDAHPGGGVAAYYDAPRKRWAADYPETTGYLIPTCLSYAQRTGRDEFHQRALAMAYWECDIQLASGAVRAGHMDARVTVPTVFNTGQVLFGWAAAWQASHEPRFAESLSRAATWLIDVQDSDGAWRRHGSPFATYSINTYNLRSALGLLRAAEVLDEPHFRAAARANMQWALTRMHANGWLEDNDLEDNSRPLTHTLGYSLHALVELAVYFGDDAALAGARHALSHLARAQRLDGGLAGRFDADWRPAARWDCLTGTVQLAHAWLLLADHDKNMELFETADRAIRFVAATQATAHVSPGIRGAVAGSFPRRGGYMRGAYPNWAAKFFMDAAMARDGIAGAIWPASHGG